MPGNSGSLGVEVAMLIQPYRPEELRFAYSYHLYLRWRTLRRRPCPPLAALDQPTLQGLMGPLGIHVLECVSDAVEVRVLVSLKPQESVSACASKLKGQTSKWLNQALGSQTP